MEPFDENEKNKGNYMDNYVDKYDEEEFEDEFESNRSPVAGEEYTYEDPVYSHEHHDANHKLIEVEEVVGFGSGETIVEVCIPLNPPAFEVMKTSIEKTLVFDAVIAGNDKVFINARLIKNIPYKTKCQTAVSGCERISRLTFGDIKHVTAEIPVALCIDVPGAKKGDKVVILKFEVESIEILNHLGCAPNSCIGICEPPALRFDTCQIRPIKSITEKDCITVKVKVVKPVIMPIKKCN